MASPLHCKRMNVSAGFYFIENMDLNHFGRISVASTKEPKLGTLTNIQMVSPFRTIRDHTHAQTKIFT